MTVEIVSINVGKPKAFDHNGKEIQTGLFKKQVKEPIYLRKINFDGDGQADLIHHGGEDKAVCVYPFEHYSYWEKELNQELVVAAFGENLTLKGLTEKDVHIGDIFQIGEAKVQVSQPRRPCYKLAYRYKVPEMVEKVQNTGYTGFYFRVVEEGWVSPESTVERIETHPLRITVQYANQIMHHDQTNTEGIQRILAVDALSASWRERLTKR